MKKCLVFLWAVTAVVSVATIPQSFVRAGIMIDGRESTYETLAQEPQFNAIGRFVEGQRISGTLIAPNWVLTAGHVDTVSNFQIRGTGTVYSIAEVIKHPTFLANGGDISRGFDLALVRLNTSVVGVTPASIYRGTNELGQLATITGFGDGGVGSIGLANLPAIQRAGTNVIDAILNFTNGAQQSALLTDFDGPNVGNNTTGSAAITSHEYQLARGDSGGGMFIFENGEWKLAGVNSGIAPQNALIVGGSANNAGFGAISVYTRVTSFQTFIDGITAVPEPSSFVFVSIATSALMICSVRRRKIINAAQDYKCT